MPAFIAQMSLLDYLAFGAVAWLVIRGFLRGCSGEVSGLVGLLAAAALGYFGFAPVERTVLAAKLRTSRSALNRLLDTRDTSLTLTTLASAAAALGKHVKIELAA